MDLWIRSQDKHILAKYNMFAVAQITPKTKAKVMAFVSDDLGYQELGTYNTKERALEVLDEIQELLQGQDIMLVKADLISVDDLKDIRDFAKKEKVIAYSDDTEIKYIAPSTMVYEMPKE